MNAEHRGTSEPASAGVRHIIIRPNRSISSRGLIWLFAAYIGLMLVIGGGFLRAGAWMVLPFAGLEALVIFAIFYFYVYRRLDDHEVVILDGESLRIVKHEAKSHTRFDFQRYWTQVDIEPGERQWHASRLVLRSRGRAVEIGACMGEADRTALASRLRRMIGQTAYT